MNIELDFGIEEVFMMFAILLGLMIFFGLVLIIAKKKRDAENAAQPILTKRAKLIDMQQIPAGQVVFGEIWTMFELEDGNRVKLHANVKNSLVVGDIGLLTWQGKKILKFERERKSI